MKKLLLIIAVIALYGCGQANTYELVGIAKTCGGIDKVHSLWFDGSVVKAYCLDGSRAGKW